MTGLHTTGVARHAYLYYNAHRHVASGRTGNAYAIPTKGDRGARLPIEEIRQHVDAFILYAAANPALEFDIQMSDLQGGYSPSVYMTLFRDAPSNCTLPEGWPRNAVR